MNLFLGTVLAGLSLFVSGSVFAEISADEALAIAAKTPEALAILEYREGLLADCLKITATRSCDSDWVTCRDDAWVVQYRLTPECPAREDGRLSVNLLIDGLSGEVVSRYPEKEYFLEDFFCREHDDCLTTGTLDHTVCLNFVGAAFVEVLPQAERACRCQNSRCILKP